MVTKHPLIYFIAGLVFGSYLMWAASEINVAIPDEQLDKLSSVIIKSIESKLSVNNQVSSNYPRHILSADSIDVSNALIDKLKSDLTPVIIDELNVHQSEILAAIKNNSQKRSSLNNQEYQQYYQAQSMLNAIGNGSQMTLNQFVTDPNVVSLPDALKKKLMGEVAMMLTSGELTPEGFLAR